ncbi:unnamed protein product [Leptidea sinapis]|uniref:Uncharacterized protein n=1 Tax=Leptidea sinapis TaxID=189913 RepID=A0A5E4R612_9NEOP|nr:unnamed protein product [Leptidea sinapis]
MHCSFDVFSGFLGPPGLGLVSSTYTVSVINWNVGLMLKKIGMSHSLMIDVVMKKKTLNVKLENCAEGAIVLVRRGLMEGGLGTSMLSLKYSGRLIKIMCHRLRTNSNVINRWRHRAVKFTTAFVTIMNAQSNQSSQKTVRNNNSCSTLFVQASGNSVRTSLQSSEAVKRRTRCAFMSFFIVCSLYSKY